MRYGKTEEEFRMGEWGRGKGYKGKFRSIVAGNHISILATLLLLPVIRFEDLRTLEQITRATN